MLNCAIYEREGSGMHRNVSPINDHAQPRHRVSARNNDALVTNSHGLAPTAPPVPSLPVPLRFQNSILLPVPSWCDLSLLGSSDLILRRLDADIREVFLPGS